ncbi:MAG: fumarylacetoacetase [Phycisphaerales bacterium]
MHHPIDESHDPGLTSWVESANDPATDFPLQNLPFGVFHTDDEDEGDARIGIAIGDKVVDLLALCEAGAFDAFDDEDNPIEEDLDAPALSILLMSGRERWGAIRDRVRELLTRGNEELASQKALVREVLHDMDDCHMLVPGEIGDYTDFYASVHHATNVGSMFRPDNPLLPNYKWIPIGYHGRASSIVASGTDIRRPCGQTRPDDSAPPIYGPCKLLDYELEVGCMLGPANAMGDRLPIERAEEAIFGICLVNDWSARDMQKWEYQPLGPFLAKSFATTVSPWVVPIEALAPFRTSAFERPEGDPRPLPHLDSDENRAHGGIDITLEVLLASKQMRDQGIAPVRVSIGSFRHMYWTFAQMVTHHASNGCNLEPGDLLASGTVSGPERESRGCLLEMTWEGPGKDRRPIELPTGETRTFLQDHDEVILRGWCEREGYRRIGFGSCSGVVLPAHA